MYNKNEIENRHRQDRSDAEVLTSGRERARLILALKKIARLGTDPIQTQIAVRALRAVGQWDA